MLNYYQLYSKLFTRKSLYKFHKLLYNFSLRGMGILNYENSKVSGEKFLIKEYLPTIFKSKHPVVFDVGANVGNYTKALSDSFPNANIYSFEPQPLNFSKLKQLSSKKIKIFELALGAKEGKFFLFDRKDCPDGSEHASLYREVISDIHYQAVKRYPVKVTTLDNIVKKEKLNKIDFLKIDTEGNELEVLKGAKELLKSNKITCIHFEFNEMNKISKVFMNDFFKILPNYTLYRLLPNGLLPLSNKGVDIEIFAYQNIVAIKKD